MDPFYSIDSYVPRVSIGYLLRRVNKLGIQRVEAAFEGNDITFTQWAVLALVSNDVATTCTELSRKLDHDKGALTRVIDQLVERSLIARHRDAGDRRVSQLSITDKGRETVGELGRRVVDTWNEILADFDHDEVVRTIDMLTRLVAKLDACDLQPEQ